MDFPMEILSQEPSVKVFKNILDKECCKRIIMKNGENLIPSYVTNGKKLNISKHRTSSSIFISKNSQELQKLKSNICNLNKWEISKTENFQFVRYEENQKYEPHYDAFDISELKNSATKYQRIMTNIIYLNDNFDGGETFFPMLNINVKPEIGKMLTFENCIPTSQYLNPFSLHQSRPIKRGKKNILTLWFIDDIAQ
jgi:prolyl 4-hydroxylase